MYMDSVRSVNSLEDASYGRHACRDVNCMGHVPLPLTNPHRDIGQSKTMDVDPDAIQVMADVELQQLPEAVNREIIKNSREIVFEEDFRESEITKEDHQLIGKTPCAKRNLVKYPLLDEERRSLNDLRKNLCNRNFPISCEEGRRSLNGSRRNLNGSKRYLLLTIDNSNSNRNLHTTSGENLIGARRHTGSREHLDVIKRNMVYGMKSSKEIHEVPEMKRKLNDNDIEVHNKVSIETEKIPTKGPVPSDLREIFSEERNFPPPPPSRSPKAARSPISDLSPESGFFEGNQSSPESGRRNPIPNVSTRNRRSYENAQLQDVNRALSRRNSVSSSSDSDGQSKTLIGDVETVVSIGKQATTNGTPPKQTISYTSV